jgi:hypothetical protein
VNEKRIYFFEILFYLLKNQKEETNGDDNESIKDEQVRKNIQTLSARLYDLKERFVKIVHQINKDSNEFADQISDEGK